MLNKPTRIIMPWPSIEDLDKFAKTVTEKTTWAGDEFGLNLKDILDYARDGLQVRDDNMKHAEEYDGEDEIDLQLQMEARRHGAYNPGV